MSVGRPARHATTSSQSQDLFILIHFWTSSGSKVLFGSQHADLEFIILRVDIHTDPLIPYVEENIASASPDDPVIQVVSGVLAKT